jgi:peptide/nickel transport system ATP-binding protein
MMTGKFFCMASETDLLRVENLDVSFSLFGDRLSVVKGASLRILPGKVTALVGESGSGKSIISQAVMGILPTPAQASGRILFTDPKNGKTTDILSLSRDSPPMRALRGGRMATIFQEPMTSLSPLHTVGNQISEALRIHSTASKEEQHRKTEEMLELVGFQDPKRTYNMYPFELSGGMRQRAMIAMALICSPALLIADEPTTALDVTIQAQILDLLNDLKARLGMAIMLITHAMGVVAETAQRVVVMYAGKVVEEATVERLFAEPLHPYTQGLIRSIPRIDRAATHKTRLETIAGVVPRLLDPPPGCRFSARCRFASAACVSATPPLVEVTPGHKVACVLHEASRGLAA